MEVSLPSGFSVDRDALPSLELSQHVKRVDSREADSMLVLYFDKVRMRAALEQPRCSRCALHCRWAARTSAPRSRPTDRTSWPSSGPCPCPSTTTTSPVSHRLPCSRAAWLRVLTDGVCLQRGERGCSTSRGPARSATSARTSSAAMPAVSAPASASATRSPRPPAHAGCSSRCLCSSCPWRPPLRALFSRLSFPSFLLSGPAAHVVMRICEMSDQS